jgi:hypothetical protein
MVCPAFTLSRMTGKLSELKEKASLFKQRVGAGFKVDAAAGAHHAARQARPRGQLARSRFGLSKRYVEASV